jgi:predicted transposase YdaD
MDYINLSEEEKRMIDAAERRQADIDSMLVQSEKRVERRTKKNEAIKTALKLLKLGLSIEQIAEVVELPIETILKIQRGEIFDI